MADKTTRSAHPWGQNTRTEVPCGQGGEIGQVAYTDRRPETVIPDGEPGAFAYQRQAERVGLGSVAAEDYQYDALHVAISRQFNDLYALFWDRQRKYGPGNIAAFGDFGVLVRCHDKLARLRRHYVEGTGDMPDESVDDAWRDLAVYAVIALVCRKGQWPGWQK